MWFKIPTFLLLCSTTTAFSNERSFIRENGTSELNSKSDKLIFANVIFRHGERNIDATYPNDPYKDESHWPGGFRALTNNGKKQTYRLGQFLRNYYNQILGNKYSAKDVYIRSTDYDRAIMSAQTTLAGLFPPANEEIWNENILWQPIPVHTVSYDYQLFGASKCLKFKENFEKYTKNSSEVREMLASCVNLYPILSERSGMNISSVLKTYSFFDTLYTEHLHNKSLPDWAYEFIQPNGVLGEAMKFFLKINSQIPELARYTSGFLLKEMLQRFDHKINSTLQPDRSLWLYSAHDYTIINLLNSLGLYQSHIVGFASSLHFELYETDENVHYVQLLYKKSEHEDPLPMDIPNCGEKCPLNQFYELYNAIIPDDYDVECSTSP